MTGLFRNLCHAHALLTLTYSNDLFKSSALEQQMNVEENINALNLSLRPKTASELNFSKR